jgi:hypothetical protein
VVARQAEDILSLIVSLEAMESECLWGTKWEAEHAVNCELVHCKMLEENSAVSVQRNSSGQKEADIKILSDHWWSEKKGKGIRITGHGGP